MCSHARDGAIDAVAASRDGCRREDRFGQPRLAGDRCPDRGKDVEVLVEGRDELGRTYGRIRQGKRAIVMGRGEPGELVTIRVVQATAGQLTGARAA